MKQSRRIEIAKDTLEILERGFYNNEKGGKVELTGILTGKFANQFQRIVFAVKTDKESIIELFRRRFNK